MNVMRGILEEHKKWSKLGRGKGRGMRHLRKLAVQSLSTTAFCKAQRLFSLHSIFLFLNKLFIKLKKIRFAKSHLHDFDSPKYWRRDERTDTQQNGFRKEANVEANKTPN
jgi:hypothetical protein